MNTTVFLTDYWSILQTLQSPGREQIFSNIRQELSLLKNKTSVILQWILSVVLEAMRKQISCQKWEANWSNLHTPCPTAKQRPYLETASGRSGDKRLDTGTEEDSIHQLDRVAQDYRLRTGHCQVLSHLHRLKISHSDECPCGTGPQTHNHVLQSSPTFDALNARHGPVQWIPTGSFGDKLSQCSRLWTSPYSPD